MNAQYNRITRSVSEFVKSRHGFVALGLICVMFVLGMSSMVGNSAIMDEVAHIPAAYAYLHYGDYRLNPEHPPLIKDLAAIPLQFMNLKFPINSVEWNSEVNGEWDAGWDFLYNLGNNADAILFWARLPLLLLALAFGGLFYWYTQKKWGIGVGLLALTFYVLSPNVLAGAITVTTDLGSAIFIFLALITFARFLAKPTRANVVLLSLALAGAQLAKFNGVTLYPFMALFVAAVAYLPGEKRESQRRLSKLGGGFIVACLLSVAWIWIFYTPNVWNMPTSVQDNLISGSLVSPSTVGIGKALVWMSHVVIFKPIVQYVLGVTMVVGRVAGGNVTYFNGAVNDSSFHGFFPETFAFKTQVAFLILMLGVTLAAVWRTWRNRAKPLIVRLRKHVASHMIEWIFGTFAVFYFLIAVMGNLDLGVRHILPVYLPVFVLIAIETIKWLRRWTKTQWTWGAIATFTVLVAWYAISTLVNAPNYQSYFNELIGGPGNAYKYFSDSNVDWGQDLKRLQIYLAAHPEIHHIAIDYFGGGSVQYSFCQRMYTASGQLMTGVNDYDCSHSIMEIWHSSYGQYTGQYIAVSETFLENDKYYSEMQGVPGYAYLRAKKPIAKIGNSIYIFKLY